MKLPQTAGQLVRGDVRNKGREDRDGPRSSPEASGSSDEVSKENEAQGSGQLADRVRVSVLPTKPGNDGKRRLPGSGAKSGRSCENPVHFAFLGLTGPQLTACLQQPYWKIWCPSACLVGWDDSSSTFYV